MALIPTEHRRRQPSAVVFASIILAVFVPAGYADQWRRSAPSSPAEEAVSVVVAAMATGLVYATIFAGLTEKMRADEAATTADARIKDATFGCGTAEMAGRHVIYRLHDCVGRFVRADGTIEVTWRDGTDGLHASVVTPKRLWSLLGEVTLDDDVRWQHLPSSVRNQTTDELYVGQTHALVDQTKLDGPFAFRTNGATHSVTGLLGARTGGHTFFVELDYHQRAITACPERGEVTLRDGKTTLRVHYARTDHSPPKMTWTRSTGEHGEAQIVCNWGSALGPH